MRTVTMVPYRIVNSSNEKRRTNYKERSAYGYLCGEKNYEGGTSENLKAKIADRCKVIRKPNHIHYGG
jgi:hypothetical protein